MAGDNSKLLGKFVRQSINLPIERDRLTFVARVREYGNRG